MEDFELIRQDQFDILVTAKPETVMVTSGLGSLGKYPTIQQTNADGWTQGILAVTLAYLTHIVFTIVEKQAARE